MKNELFLIYFDFEGMFTKEAKPNFIQLSIEKETPKQFTLKGNPLSARILNKNIFSDNGLGTVSSTFRNHVIVLGRENIDKGYEYLISKIEGQIIDTKNKLDNLNSRLEGLIEARQKYNECGEASNEE